MPTRKKTQVDFSKIGSKALRRYDPTSYEEIEREHTKFRANFESSTPNVHKLEQYFQQRFEKQLGSLRQACFPDLVRHFLKWAQSLALDNHELMFDCVGLKRAHRRNLSEGRRATYDQIGEFWPSLLKTQSKFSEEINTSWLTMMAGVTPPQLSPEKAQALREVCRFDEIVQEDGVMFAKWYGPKRSWRLENASGANKRRFEMYALRAATEILGPALSSERADWQRWLDLLMLTDAFFLEREHWEEGGIGSVCAESATYLERLVLDAAPSQLTSPTKRRTSTVSSPAAVKKMDAFLDKNGIGLTDFASTAQTTDRTLRKFRKTSRVRRDIFENIAKAMGLTKDDLLKPND